MKFNNTTEEAEYSLKSLGEEPAFVDESLNNNIAHYVFYNKKQDIGVCSHCGSWFSLKKMLEVTQEKYGEAFGNEVPKIQRGSGEYVCPECYTGLQAYPYGYSRGKLATGCRANYWQRKGKTLYLIIKLVNVDFKSDRASFHKIPRAIYIYGRNGTRRLANKYDTWVELKTIKYQFEPSFMGGNNRYDFNISCNPPDELLKGSYLDYAYDEDGYLFELKDTMACNQCTDFSPAWIDCEYLAAFQRFPAVEVLHKTGFDYLIGDRIRGAHTWNAVNWKATHLRKIFRNLNMKEIREIRDEEYGFTTIRNYQLLKKQGLKVSLRGTDLASGNYGRTMNDFAEAVGARNLEKAINYIGEQCVDWHIYTDYLRECEQLERDLDDKKVRYPKNLMVKHRQTTAELMEARKLQKTKEQEERAKKFIQQIESAFPEGYEWHRNGLIIRPALSPAELIREGNAMHHCVGGYDRQVASGTSFIIFIRHEEDPDKSFVTMECTQDFKMIQIRARANMDPDPEVKATAKEWLAEYKKDQKKLMKECRKETA